jgi:hypothetical protein
MVFASVIGTEACLSSSVVSVAELSVLSILLPAVAFCLDRTQQNLLDIDWCLWVSDLVVFDH